MAIGDGGRLGFNSRIGFGQETTWGTLVTATSFMEFRSETLKLEKVNEKIESLGTGRAIARRVQKEVNLEGTFLYDLHPVDGIALIKHALMGSVTSALAGTTDAYNHTFTTGDISGIAQKGLTFEVQPDQNTTTCFIHYGLRVNSFKISASIGEPVKTEISFIGKDSTTGTFATTTVAYSPVRPFLFQDGTFAYGATIGVATSESIIAFEMMVENNLINDETARSIGNTSLTILPPGRRMVTLNITQRFDTTSAWDRFTQNTQGAIRLTFDTGQTIGSTDSPGTTYSMIIDFPTVFYNSAIPEITEAGILTHDVEITALADTITGSGTDILMTVVNSTSSYA